MPDTSDKWQLVEDPAEVGIDPVALKDLITRCRREVDEGLLPSSQMAVAAGDRLVAFETFGEAAPDSRYVIFSCTKVIVVSALWLLLGNGSLSVDDRVAEVIPEFGTNGKDVVTVRQLLLHEGGFPHAPLNLDTDLTREQRLARFSSWRLEWEPGTRYEYHATSAHWVIAELIERLSGVEFRRFVHERVLGPLGLPRLQLGVPLEEQGDINTLVARGEPPTDEEIAAVLGIPGVTLASIQGEVTEAALLGFNLAHIRSMGVPGAGAISTAAEMALFYQALLHNPDGLWDPAVLRAGTREVHGILPDPWYHVSSNRALGTVIAGDGNDKAMRGFGHTVSSNSFGHGGAGGQIAIADPDVDVSFCYLTNGLDANMLRSGRRTASIASAVGPLTTKP